MLSIEICFIVLFLDLVFLSDKNGTIRGVINIICAFLLGIFSEIVKDDYRGIMVFLAFVYFLAGMFILIKTKNGKSS